MTKKRNWNIKLTLIIKRTYPRAEITKKDAIEMALQDFYDDMRHIGCCPTPKIEVE